MENDNISIDQLRESYVAKLISLLSACYEYDGLQLPTNTKVSSQKQKQKQKEQNHVNFRKDHI